MLRQAFSKTRGRPHLQGQRFSYEARVGIRYNHDADCSKLYGALLSQLSWKHLASLREGTGSGTKPCRKCGKHVLNRFVLCCNQWRCHEWSTCPPGVVLIFLPSSVSSKLDRQSHQLLWQTVAKNFSCILFCRPNA